MAGVKKVHVWHEAGGASSSFDVHAVAGSRKATVTLLPLLRGCRLPLAATLVIDGDGLVGEWLFTSAPPKGASCGVVQRRKAEHCRAAVAQARFADAAQRRGRGHRHEASVTGRQWLGVSVQRCGGKQARVLDVAHHAALFDRLRGRQTAVSTAAATVEATLADAEDDKFKLKSSNGATPKGGPGSGSRGQSRRGRSASPERATRSRSGASVAMAAASLRDFVRWQAVHEYVPPRHALRYVVKFHRHLSKGAADFRDAPLTITAEASRFARVYHFCGAESRSAGAASGRAADATGATASTGRRMGFPSMSQALEGVLCAYTRAAAEHLERSHGLFCLDLALEFVQPEVPIGARRGRGSGGNDVVCTAALGARWIQCAPLWGMPGAGSDGLKGASTPGARRDRSRTAGRPASAGPSRSSQPLHTPLRARTATFRGDARGQDGSAQSHPQNTVRRDGLSLSSTTRKRTPAPAAWAVQDAATPQRAGTSGTARVEVDAASENGSSVDGSVWDIEQYQEPDDLGPSGAPSTFHSGHLTNSDIIKSATAQAFSKEVKEALADKGHLGGMSTVRGCRTAAQVGLAGEHRRALTQLKGSQTALLSLLEAYKRSEAERAKAARLNRELAAQVEEVNRLLSSIEAKHKAAMAGPQQQIKQLESALSKERTRRQVAESRVHRLSGDVLSLEDRMGRVKSSLRAVQERFGLKVTDGENVEEVMELAGTYDRASELASERRIQQMNMSLQMELKDTSEQLQEERLFKSQVFRVLADVNHPGVEKPRRLAGGFSSIPRPTVNNVNLVVQALVTGDWSEVAASAELATQQRRGSLASSVGIGAVDDASEAGSIASPSTRNRGRRSSKVGVGAGRAGGSRRHVTRRRRSTIRRLSRSSSVAASVTGGGEF